MMIESRLVPGPERTGSDRIHRMPQVRYARSGVHQPKVPSHGMAISPVDGSHGLLYPGFFSTPIPASAYSGNKMSVLFAIVDLGAWLLASISVKGFCLSTLDGAPCTWSYVWTDDTNSTAGLEEAFAISAPQQAVQIPASVASTFTGASQASAVSIWLDQKSTAYALPLGTMFLTVFPDGSSAEYQVTGTSPRSYSFVSNTDHAANGDPENDSGQLISAPSLSQRPKW